MLSVQILVYPIGHHLCARRATAPIRRTPRWARDLAESQYAQDPNFIAHPILHKNWIKALGYLSPPHFSCDYADTWINALAEGVGRRQRLSIINEHMHFTVGKSDVDQTYFDNRTRFKRDDVPKLYGVYVGEREEGIQKLREFIDAF